MYMAKKIIPSNCLLSATPLNLWKIISCVIFHKPYIPSSHCVNVFFMTSTLEICIEYRLP